jgi:hypothetical protein
MKPWVETVTALLADNQSLRSKYATLARRHNKLIQEYNAVAPRPPGRPVETTEAQQDEVLRLRKAGASIRTIAAQTGLGRGAVSGIVTKGVRTAAPGRHLSPIAVEPAGALAIPEAIADTLRGAAQKS